MARKTLSLALLTGAVLAPLAGWAAAPLQLKSVILDLPQSDRTFTGQGADAVNNNCLACHSAGMVLNQPPLAKAAWQAEVNKMIQIYKAPVAAADVTAIVDYLARTKGAGS
jgi:mono/diheme cytochrome c family protein